MLYTCHCGDRQHRCLCPSCYIPVVCKTGEIIGSKHFSRINNSTRSDGQWVKGSCWCSPSSFQSTRSAIVQRCKTCTDNISSDERANRGLPERVSRIEKYVSATLAANPVAIYYLNFYYSPYSRVSDPDESFLSSSCDKVTWTYTGRNRPFCQETKSYIFQIMRFQEPRKIS